jgi:hypothetical protein
MNNQVLANSQDVHNHYLQITEESHENYMLKISHGKCRCTTTDNCSRSGNWSHLQAVATINREKKDEAM